MISVDRSRDQLLTSFGKATLDDRYLLPGESYQDLFARVADAYSDDELHAQRIYDYISRLWFMPATPVLSNGGTNRGLPISCFLNRVEDSMRGIASRWSENIFLASNGGGLGTYYGDVRSIGEGIGNVGKTSGVVSFLRVNDALVHAVSQGSLRRGSGAIYLPIDHPEINEFVDIRRPTGDPNRRTPNLHHGITIPDAFMEAVENDAMWALRSPKTGDVVKEVNAKGLWNKILITRLETGEPYLFFKDRVREGRTPVQKALDHDVVQSNLCTEIMLPTGRDHLGEWRTAVCCLSSLNLETFEEWMHDQRFILDVMKFLDNVLTDFIERARKIPEFKNAVYSAERERSVGLGVMGFHSLLQKRGIAFESEEAADLNDRLFRHINDRLQTVNTMLALERGSCPDAIDAGILARFSNMTAIAPTASISTIAGNSSPGIEPWVANVFTQKTLSGSFTVRNKYLADVLKRYGADNEEIWKSITIHKGSVQHLPFLSDHEKRVFRTAFELDQLWVVRMAGERQKYICQAQSVNIFLPPNVSKQYLHDVHMAGFMFGMKSFYYCRSLSKKRAEAEAIPVPNHVAGEKYEECVACQ